MFYLIHRHIVFTIDEGLRKLPLINRKELLKGLMDETANVVQLYFQKKRITPGIIAGLHTFGSQLEFNLRDHMIVTMIGLSDSGEWKNYDYIPYKLLRVHRQNAVLKLLRRTDADTGREEGGTAPSTIHQPVHELPPCFSCQKFQGQMVPKYDQSGSGITYNHRHLRSNDYN